MLFRYLKFQRGQLLILVAVSIIALVGFAGLAIDSGRGYGVKAKLNAAVDAASIAAARALAEGATDAARIAAAKKAAEDFYAANFPDLYLGASRGALTFNAEHQASGRWVVDVSGSASMPVSFMGVLGLTDDVAVSAKGQTIRRDLDVILVLDTSGSIGSDFPALRNAARDNFVNKLIESTDRVGLVTFASGGVDEVAIKTSDRGFVKADMVTKLNALSSAGYTASAEGMRRALNQLNSVLPAKRSSLRMIVFFSDGAPNTVPAIFSNCNGNLNSNGLCTGASTPVTGDLFSETIPSETTRATEVYRFDRRNTELSGSPYTRIATLPISGFDMTATNGITIPIPLVSYNNARTLTMIPTGGTDYRNSRCNVNRAARNMVENVANEARKQDTNKPGIKIYSIGLGDRLNSLEVDCYAVNSVEYGSNILKRVANTVDSDNSQTTKTTQPNGLYVYAAYGSDLDAAFSTIVNEILRLTQ